MLSFCGTHRVSQCITNFPASCCTLRSACPTYRRESDRLNSSEPCVNTGIRTLTARELGRAQKVGLAPIARGQSSKSQRIHVFIDAKRLLRRLPAQQFNHPIIAMLNEYRGSQMVIQNTLWMAGNEVEQPTPRMMFSYWNAMNQREH